MTEDFTSSGGDLVPEHLTKKEFGRRLYSLMRSRGWTQSELARQADLQRDSVSVYVRGRSLPTPKNLAKLASALGVTEQELLPNHSLNAIEGDRTPSLEIKVSTGAPNTAWLHVNRLVKMSTAVKVAELLNDDDTSLDGK